MKTQTKVKKVIKQYKPNYKSFDIYKQIVEIDHDEDLRAASLALISKIDAIAKHECIDLKDMSDCDNSVAAKEIEFLLNSVMRIYKRIYKKAD